MQVRGLMNKRMFSPLYFFPLKFFFNSVCPAETRTTSLSLSSISFNPRVVTLSLAALHLWLALASLASVTSVASSVSGFLSLWPLCLALAPVASSVTGPDLYAGCCTSVAGSYVSGVSYFCGILRVWLSLAFILLCLALASVASSGIGFHLFPGC